MQISTSAIVRIAIFILVSCGLIVISWRPLHNLKSHGFYRFFAFEGILVLILVNIPFWLDDPFSVQQLISWFLLVFSLLFVIEGVRLLKVRGGHSQRETGSENLPFEDTVNLVTGGIYGYIRHPMYGSLLLLAWGALFKHISVLGFLLAVVTTVLLVATAKAEERENIAFFGRQYQDYITRSKMFIPYIL